MVEWDYEQMIVKKKLQTQHLVHPATFSQKEESLCVLTERKRGQIPQGGPFGTHHTAAHPIVVKSSSPSHGEF